MATPVISVFAEESLGDPIDIRMDIIHPEPFVVVAFPVAAVVRTQAQHEDAIRGIQEQLLGVPIQEELAALRFRVDIAEAENASLRARIKTTEAIEKITRKRERQARVEIEQQLAAVQESQRQDRENFRKLNEHSKQEHEEHLKLILELLKKEQLYAKFSKCEFWIPKVQFLGYAIDNQGIHVDPAKIESIKEWSSPKTAMKIHQVFRSCRFGHGANAKGKVNMIAKFVITRGKAYIVADMLSRKERNKPLRVRALVMTISLDLPKQILEAQTGAIKTGNLKSEDVGGRPI
uniref:Putative reverse transcriptase domain-containing protein n=1 Tax=Tanacetum cinerariifolium TaxID=118510 RepID=A0A699GQA5_TANCI|nr:putative reverse transcriptase domain-containing protein [Tanacetum cinerariifolium]